MAKLFGDQKHHSKCEHVRQRRQQLGIQVVSEDWHRQPEGDGVLEYCHKEGLTFLPWSPLGGSSRAKSLTGYPDLVSMAREKGISPQQLALAWLLAKSPCVLPIPGATRTRSVEDSLAAVQVELTPDEVERLGRAVG